MGIKRLEASSWDGFRRALDVETQAWLSVHCSVRMRSTIGSCGSMCHAPTNIAKVFHLPKSGFCFLVRGLCEVLSVTERLAAADRSHVPSRAWFLVGQSGRALGWNHETHESARYRRFNPSKLQELDSTTAALTLLCAEPVSHIL